MKTKFITYKQLCTSLKTTCVYLVNTKNFKKWYLRLAQSKGDYIFVNKFLNIYLKTKYTFMNEGYECFCGN